MGIMVTTYLGYCRIYIPFEILYLVQGFIKGYLGLGNKVEKSNSVTSCDLHYLTSDPCFAITKMTTAVLCP